VDPWLAGGVEVNYGFPAADGLSPGGYLIEVNYRFSAADGLSAGEYLRFHGWCC
jgi:hypothetical protein